MPQPGWEPIYGCYGMKTSSPRSAIWICRSPRPFFRDLLKDAGLVVPEDWKARVRTGSDRRLSRTASENLKLNLPVGVSIPKVLPDTQKALVDYHAPGLRALLGYA